MSTLSPTTHFSAKHTSSSNSSNVSSSDLASSSQLPSVNVSLSGSDGRAASVISSIPPLYNKPTVPPTHELQVSPSRSNATSDGLAENSILSRSKDTEEDEAVDSRSIADEAKKESSVTRLSENDLKMIEELKVRDREVKTHEQAHKAVGGQYAGAISYSYQAGPDGKRYAVGGEVPIDVAPIADDPQATIAKMTIVRSAATAPAEPSAQDQVVAAQASMLLAQAQAELAENRSEERGGDSENNTNEQEPKPERGDSKSSERSIDTFIAFSQDDSSRDNLVDATV